MAILCNYYSMACIETPLTPLPFKSPALKRSHFLKPLSLDWIFSFTVEAPPHVIDRGPNSW